MRQYLDLLQHVRAHGVRKPTRTRSSRTGQPLDAYSVFGHLMRFDLTAGFPLLTTKRMPFRTIAHELRWFLMGESNVRYLKENKVTIWDEWADEQGELGPVYGHQWRHWPDGQGGEIDQVKQLLDNIEEVNRNPQASVGRRLILSAWNVADLPRMALAPCHLLAHFSVTRGQLSCLMYQRSADLFYGVPFNIASYALLTHLVARVTGLGVGEFIHSLGDVHIYENQMGFVEEQLRREPHPLPDLAIDGEVKDLSSWTVDQLRLVNYRHHPKLGDDDIAV